MTEHDTQPLGRMIYFMAQDIKNLAERVLSPYDLTLEQFQILKALSQGMDMTQRQLCQEINKSAANVTRILDRLEAKSLISREADPGDRRAYLVTMTVRGHILFDEVKEVFEAFSAEVHKGVTREMKQTTRKVFKIMTANVARMTEAQKKE